MHGIPLMIYIMVFKGAVTHGYDYEYLFTTLNGHTANFVAAISTFASITSDLTLS